MRITRSLLFFIVVLCFLLPGCGKDSLEELAQFQIQYYNQAKPMMDRVLSLYNDLQSEKISRPQYQAELIKMKEPASKLNAEYQSVLKKHQLSKEDEKSKLYADGLYYGHYLVREPYGYILLMTDVKTIEEINNVHENMMLIREGRVPMFESTCNELIGGI